MNQKVKDLINNKGYTQYKISNPNKNCEYNDSNRDILKQTKSQIIKTIFKYNKKIESVIANLPITSNELMDQYLEQIELNEEKERRYKCNVKKENCIGRIFKCEKKIDYREVKEEPKECIERKDDREEKKEVKCINKIPMHFLSYDEEFKKIDLNCGKKVNHKANEQIFNLLNSIFGKGIGLLIKKIDLQNRKYNEKINELNNEILLLEKEINGNINIDKINQLRSLGVKGESLVPRLNLIRLDPKTNQFIGNETSIKKDFTEFYDIIIDIKSIKGISKGWEIKKSKRAEINYERFKKDKVIRIGVIGNSNKGKSFLLSKISKIKNLPSGTSIRTEGLSVKYPELDTYKDRKIVLLDSAGLETPVLNENDNNNYNTNDDTINETNNNANNNSNNKENNGITKKEEDDIEETEENEEKSDNENKIEEQNDINNKKNEISDIENVKKQFKEKSREKLITELFLQNYIMNNSDILIIVVGIMTYSEQKLLNRIKTEILRSKLRNRPLFIIHNLITYTTIEQVEDYIKNYLLKSATFSLESGHKISTKTNTKTGVYYYEKNVDANIYHLIFANEGSQAGEYYNNLTLDFLENSYQNVINLKSFDIIETVKERFIEISKEIIERTGKPLNKKDFDNSNDKYIKLNNPKNVTLKNCLIDELGFSNLITNGFEPTYNYFQKDNKIILRIEAGGNSNIISAKVDFGGEYTYLRVKGIKKKDKEPQKLEDNIHNSRKFGNFALDIPLKPWEYIIKNEDPEVKEKKGIISIEYKLDDKISGASLLIKEEDEI